MKEVARTKPKGSFARLKSLILPDKPTSITPIDDSREESGNRVDNQNNLQSSQSSSLRGFQFSSSNRNGSDSKIISFTSSDSIQQEKSPITPVFEEKGGGKEDEDDSDHNSDNGKIQQYYKRDQDLQDLEMIPTEELRNHPETTEQSNLKKNRPNLTIDTTFTSNQPVKDKEFNLVECEFEDSNDIV